MIDDIDMDAIETQQVESNYFCICGALIEPVAVQITQDGKEVWELYDRCIDFNEDEYHVSRKREDINLLSSKASVQQLNEEQVIEMTKNQLLERKIYYCKTCEENQVHCIFMRRRANMEIEVVCVNCKTVSWLKDVAEK